MIYRPTSPPARLVIETDLFSDVDDVGALALAHRLADLGLVEVAAVMINTPSRWGAPAARILNASFGRADIPVGASRHTDDSTADRDYARPLVERFDPGSSGRTFPDATRLWRETLAREQGGVTLVSIGFFSNLCQLLTSPPDELSPLSGVQLVADKVKRTVVMGGSFPQGQEFNFTADPAETAQFLETWPTPIEFIGSEIGADVITGGTHVFEKDAPAALAYEIFCGPDHGRESWDLITVHCAAHPLSDLYRLSEAGRVELQPSGYSSWTAQPDGQHRFLSLTAAPSEVSAEIDALLNPPA